MKRVLLFVLPFCAGTLVSKAQVSITTANTSYTQDFNGLASSGTPTLGSDGSMLPNWYSNRTSYAADNGSTATVGMYSYGSTGSTERALGQIVGTGSAQRVYFGVRFKNNSGGPINSIFVKYTGEQWRKASASAATLDFTYQITTAYSGINSGTYNDFNDLDFVSVVNTATPAALDGNNSSNRVVKNSVLKFPTPLAVGQELILRWAIPNNPPQHGLAIDDLIVTFNINNELHIPAGTILQSLNVDEFNVVLDGNVTITNSLTLTQGIIYTTATNLLILNNGVGSPLLPNASNASYVNGPVRKVGNQAFTFPVGKNGKYVPITISAPVNSTDAFTAEYVPSSGTALGGITSPGLLKVSSCEYWILDRTEGTSNVDVTLYWDADNACSGPGYISDASTIVVAHFNGTSWNDHGGSGIGNTANGEVKWDNVIEYSPFTLGSISPLNALPVHFSNVKASEKLNGVEVDFTNLTESEVDYYDIERSTNGQTFSLIKRIKPEKNDYGSASYTYLDVTAVEGRNVYRIKAVETTGKTIYSNFVSITLGVKSRNLIVYTNGGQLNVQVNSLPAGKYQFKVFSVVGQLVSKQHINHTGGSFSQVLPMKNLKAGVYIYSVEGLVQMKERFLVR